MRIEPKQAFYNEDTGAVQPWKDIEVTDTVGSALVAEGLVTEIEGGGGGGDFTTAQVTLNGAESYIDVQVAFIDGDYNNLSTFVSLPPHDSLEITAVLYQGEATIWSNTADAIAVTGDATIVDGQAIITGDCTITFE